MIDGGAGSDVIYLHEVYPMDFPGLTSVRANGGGGNDTFRGSPDNDELSGGDGNDTFYASAGSDDLDASTGDDLVIVETLGDVTLTDTSLVTPDGTATISGFEDAHITSDAGRGVRIDASGFRGNTVMKTGRGDDTLIGAVGRDFLTGGRGSDRLVGRTVGASSPATRDPTCSSAVPATIACSAARGRTVAAAVRATTSSTTAEHRAGWGPRIDSADGGR